MRITILNQFYPPDLAPTAHLAASLAEHRAEQGDTVTVVTGRADYVPGASAHPRVDGAVRVIRVATPGGGKSSVVTRLAGYLGFHLGALIRLLGLPRQDVIVSLTTPPYIVTWPMLVRLVSRRTRVVLWSMDVYPDAAERFGQLDRSGVPSRLLRRLNRWIVPRLDHLVALDEPMAELLVGQYGRGARPRSTVIPNWEPSASFPANADAEPWAGYADEPLAGRSVVVYTGNTGTGHRFDTVVAAASRLDPERDAFLFVGGGVRWSELESAAVALGHHAAPFVLRGYLDRSEMPGVIGGARASLITLDDDALGVMSPSKLHASLAMGRPIVYVGPERSNVDAAIARFDCGFSLRHGDVDGLVAAIAALRDDDELHARLSANARRAFDEAHSDLVTLPHFDAILDSLGR